MKIIKIIYLFLIYFIYLRHLFIYLFIYLFIHLLSDQEDLQSIESKVDSMCGRVDDLLSITSKKSLPMLIEIPGKDKFIEKISSSYR